MAEAAPSVEPDMESPYIGSEMLDDEMTPEEQAIYDQEMNEEAEDVEYDVPLGEEPEPTPEADQEELAAENPEPEPEPEPEAAAEPEPEAAADPEEPEAPRETAQDHRIPKARLDREMAKRKELEQRLAQLEADRKVEEVTAEDTPIDVQIDAEAITKALDMNLDGKNSEAAAILIEQFQAAVSAGVTQGRTQMRSELEARTDQAVNRAVGEVSAKSAEQAYNDAVAEVEQNYSIFNPDSPDFDGELANRAVTMMGAFQADGATAAEALKEAAELTLMRHRPELVVKNTAPAEETAEPAPVNAPTAQSRQRNAAAAAAQPSRQSGKSAGAEDSKIDLTQLTEEEFDALPDSVLAEMRGDLV